MRPAPDKFAMIAEEFISSGVPLRLNPSLPWPCELTRKEYAWEITPCEGFNVFRLMQVAEERGYISPYWISLREGEAAGGELKPEAIGVAVAAWRLRRQDAQWSGDIDLGKLSILPEVEEAEENPEAPHAVAMRPQVLFNAQEWNNLELPAARAPRVLTPEESLERARAIEERGAGCEIRHGGTLAYYNPTLNYISLPLPAQYPSPQAYYLALFEQIGHAVASRHQKDLFCADSIPSAQEIYNTPSLKVLYAKMVAAILAYEAGWDVLD